TSLDHSLSRLELAGDSFRSPPAGAQGNERGGRLRPVAILQRRLQRLQSIGIHGHPPLGRNVAQWILVVPVQRAVASQTLRFSARNSGEKRVSSDRGRGRSTRKSAWTRPGRCERTTMRSAT